MTTIRDFAVRCPLLTVFAVALGVRVVAAIVLVHTGVDDRAAFDDDTYGQMAAAVVEGATDEWDGYTRSLYNATASFTVPLTVVYSLFGSSVYAGPWLAGLFGAAAATLVAALARRALGPAWALAAGLTVALLPSQVLWSSLTLKDATVWAVSGVIAMLVAQVIEASGRALAIQTALLVAALVALAHVRIPTFAVAVWALVITLVVLPGGQRLWRAVLALVVFAVVPLALGFGVGALDVVGKSQTEIQQRRMWNAFGAATAILPEDGTSERIAAVDAELNEVIDELAAAERDVHEVIDELAAAERDGHEPRTSAGASPPSPELAAAQARLDRLQQREQGLREELSQAHVVDTDEADEALSANVRHLPRGLSVMLLEPLPWQATPSANLKAAKLDTLTLYPLLALAAVGLLSVRRHPRTLLFPVLLGGGVLGAYALTEGNFGTAYRHRAELMPTLVLVATLGGHMLWARRRRGASPDG